MPYLYQIKVINTVITEITSINAVLFWLITNSMKVRRKHPVWFFHTRNVYVVSEVEMHSLHQLQLEEKKESKRKRGKSSNKSFGVELIITYVK